MTRISTGSRAPPRYLTIPTTPSVENLPVLETTDLSSDFVEEHDTYWRDRSVKVFRYESCKLDELKAFMSQRGRSINAIVKKKNLNNALRLADQNLTFYRLFELPPELCVRIYDMYHAGFDQTKPLHMPAMPPLVRASKQTREESLPVFFKSCTFDVQLLEAEIRMPNWDQNGWALRMNPASALFFTILDKDRLASIKRLCLTVHTAENDMYADGLVLACYISVSDGGQTFVVTCRAKDDYSRKVAKSSDDQRFRKVEKAMVEPLEAMKHRRGDDGIKLRLDDIYALRNAIERGWYDRGIEQ